MTGTQQIHKHYIGTPHKFTILTKAESIQSEKLRGYVAAVHFMELDSKEDAIRPPVTILKTFFINDKNNLNDWRATWEGLKEDAKLLPGTPLVLQEDLEHPKFSVQKFFDRGTIFDYEIDEENKQIIVYIRITDASIIDRIKSGELEYVSPAIIPRGSEYAEIIDGVDTLSRSLPLHLAIVGDPAYGKDVAKMTEMCTGPGEACMHRLKILSTSNPVQQALQNEFNADAIDSLTQTPFIKKMVAKAARVASVMDSVIHNTPTIHNHHEGVWIKAKGLDVFVAKNQSIQSAIKSQCGCTASAKKVSKELAHYRDTMSTDQNCTTCIHYNASKSSCAVVSGKITPGHTSDLWKSEQFN